ncbi:hypothetical protein Q75_08190 [Bacillus coahuilensis p1.1.43]|uniref:Protein-L-IsoD(D-D) O-methyltransferase n=1 Tax=Bacillus coahuilensis p1.1.43 TaxID=1150625 RepID=A0A147K8N7_9BACI|nr:class I SAM-dependent methyltransferase [Bacillus coahuilensis]KUP06497.1 hypothetical protein Q75_08190 [Bacillus coahuilensis p1.1.43]
MLVTTAGRVKDSTIKNALHLSKELGSTYINRNKQSVEKLHESYQQDILVVGIERIELYPLKGGHLFFHPNLAMLRIKRLLQQHKDAFLEATQLNAGDNFLDCTLGLGSDSIVASYATTASGKVVALEVDKRISTVVEHGLNYWESSLPDLTEAMRRIEVVNAHHLAYLKSQPSNAFEVIYFDPMFDESISGSNGISAIKMLAHYESLDLETIKEARRVAKKRVVLKDHFRSLRFKYLGFTQLKRKSAEFHYGYIDLI